MSKPGPIDPLNPLAAQDEFTAAQALISRLKGDTIVEVEMHEEMEGVILLLIFESGAMLRIPMEEGLDILIPLTSGATPRGN